MVKNSWVKEAKEKGTLKITENLNCPYCNPTHSKDVPTKINACEEHLWVNKKWYEEKF
jgi:hypothetical protein